MLSTIHIADFQVLSVSTHNMAVTWGVSILIVLVVKVDRLAKRMDVIAILPAARPLALTAYMHIMLSFVMFELLRPSFLVSA